MAIDLTDTGFYQNCRGLRTKLLNFRCNTSCFNYIFFVLTETWLTNSINNCELGFLNYIIFRFDRYSLSNNYIRGGGVLIGVHKDIPSHLITVSQHNIEQVFVPFKLSSLAFIIGGVYIPPQSPLLIYKTHVEFIDHFINEYLLLFSVVIIIYPKYHGIEMLMA